MCVCMYLCMDGWMDGWMDVCMCAGMHVQIDVLAVSLFMQKSYLHIFETYFRYEILELH